MRPILVFAQAISIGVISYWVGLIPLVVKSESLFSILRTLGNGRLIGYAIYIVLAKTFAGAASTMFKLNQSALSRTVAAVADMGGVYFMWIINRRLSRQVPNGSRHPQPRSETDIQSVPLAELHSKEGDTELGEQAQIEALIVEPQAAVAPQPPSSSHAALAEIGPRQQRIYLFTLALLFQVFMEGTNNGYLATSISPSSKSQVNVNAGKLQANGVEVPNLDLFMSYLHSLFDKALMAFALSTTLRSASFPIARCKQHLMAIAAACTIGEIFSYSVITILNISASQYRLFPIFALRSFADGMFIYAAFVLRASLIKPAAKARGRICSLCVAFPLMVFGAFMPWIGTLVVVFPITLTWVYMKSSNGAHGTA